MDSQTVLYSAALAVPALWALWSVVGKKNQLPLPPGPKRYPLIGNMLNFPQSEWGKTFTEWQKTHGDLIYANLLGTPVLVVNSLEVADDLCVKRGQVHSGRPRSVMGSEIMGWTWNVVAMDPGPRHQAIRRIFRESVGAGVVASHDPMILREAENYILSLRGYKGSPVDLSVAGVAAVVIPMAYGPTVYKDHGKELTKLNQAALDQITDVSTKLWVVEFWPSLQNIPEWTPGATFKRVGAHGRQMQERIHWWPWNEVNARYKEGRSGPCIAVNYIEKGEDQQLAQDAIGMMYAAGVDTTSANVINFLYAMMTHPHLQRKVQAELDGTIGQDRLPVPNDRPNLPYADAAWKESVRWHPTSPVGIPRRTTQDDTYKGMFIPKDAMILFNIGFMLRDPRVYEKPDEYRPERWLEAGGKDLPDPNSAAFGFGTRACAGRFLAERIGFCYAMSVLAAYDVVPLKGKEVKDVRNTVYEDAIVSRPVGFECEFVPRSNLAWSLLGEH